MTVNSEHLRAFRQDLLEWYRGAARDLPWRATSDPYLIWISEIMLQQTRVDQAIPYFERFISRFPRVEALAQADLEKVLVAWEGLGYYSRARNLHRAARIVIDEMEGSLPTTSADLRRLPGIGPYTSAAIASIAFDEPVAAIDGNATRVMARVFAIRDDIKSTGAKRKIQRLAESLIDQRDPGDFNQGMMELGATICTPKQPECLKCPLSDVCGAFASEQTDSIPYSTKKRRTPQYDVAVGVVRDRPGRILLVRRDEDGLLGGLWEFPGSKVADGESPEDACCRGIREKLGLEVKPVEMLTAFKHQYSHFGIAVQAFDCKLLKDEGQHQDSTGRRWIHVSDLENIPMHRSARRVADLVSGATT
jgi:A/G-specific adenine glycosylase